MIVATGNDIIEIERLERVLRRHGERFIQRVFTDREQEYCRQQPHPPQHYAARFAGKEAVLKVLGTGWDRGIHWRDVEILRTEKGDPFVEMHGNGAIIAAEQGIDIVHISLSHSRTLALATAIGERFDDLQREASGRL